MKPQLGYLPADLAYPFRGLNTLDPASLMNGSFSPECLNYTVIDGVLTKRKGYIQLGQTLSANQVMSLINFQTASGKIYLVAITLTKEYYFDSATSLFIEITKNTGGISGGGTPINRTGSESDTISWVVNAGTDTGQVLIITNGVDKPRQWDGNTAHFFVDVSWNYPGLVTCKTVSAANGSLVIGAPTGASVTPQNVAWSSGGTNNEFLAGTAGEQTLYDTVGSIQSLVPLANTMVVYSENSIHTMQFVGGDYVFVFQKLLEETRLLSSRSIVNLGPFHVFLSQDNIIVFDGSRTTPAVADVIHKTYRDELSTAYRYRAFGFLDRARERAYFGIPTSSTTIKIYWLEYDIRNLANWTWTPVGYNDRPQSMGFYTQDNDLQWNSASIATVTWSGYSGAWNSGSANKGFPSRVIGGIDGKVYLGDDSIADDNGVAVSSHWDTKDFTLPQEYQSENARFTQIEIESRGTDVDVYYSLDGGLTFVFICNCPLSSNYQSYRIFLDVVSRLARVRFVNNSSGGNFELRWFRLWFTPIGPN